MVSATAIIAVVTVLVAGTVAAIANKVAYQTKVEGLNGDVHVFTKAYLFTGLMFIGEFLCLFWFYIDQWWTKRKALAATNFPAATLNTNYQTVGGASSTSGGLHQNMLSQGAGSSTPVMKYGSAASSAGLMRVDADEEAGGPLLDLPKPPIWNYAVLSLCDLTASTVTGVGSIWVSASTTQMLRGSSVLFTGLCSMLILKVRLTRGQWMGILTVVLALGMVGASSELREIYDGGNTSNNNNGATSGQVLLGIVLILIGSLVNSVQGVFEEKLLKGQGYAEVEALEVVGWEGFFGSLFSFAVMLPICQAVKGDDYGGLVENTTDSWVQLKNSPLLIWLCIAYIISLALLNNFMQVISKELSAVIRQLVATCRVVVVWVVGIILYYAYPDKGLGEGWDRWCFMQLAAFVVLVAGTMLYVTSRAAPSEQPPAEDEVLTKSLNSSHVDSSAL